MKLSHCWNKVANCTTTKFRYASARACGSIAIQAALLGERMSDIQSSKCPHGQAFDSEKRCWECYRVGASYKVLMDQRVQLRERFALELMKSHEELTVEDAFIRADHMLCLSESYLSRDEIWMKAKLATIGVEFS